MSKVGSLFREMRRRGVLQIAAMYIVGAWVLLQAADVLFPGAGIPDSAIRFVFVGIVLCFPLIMVFGWMYDTGAKGITRTPSVQDSSREGGLPLRRADYLIVSGLSVLAMALIIGVSIKVVSQSEIPVAAPSELPVAKNSIAVLPFVNMSDDPENEYLGDGIAEELLNELTNLTSLHVAARTSSFSFKGKNEPVQSIGRQLGVGTVLEGSVRRSGDSIRITAQLINAADGYHLWSQTFDRKTGDIFVIQEEIAEAITKALKVKLLSSESGQHVAPTDSFDAYDYYLLGQYYREKRNPASLEKSVELFKQALDIDDRFALGYVALAASHLYQAYYSGFSPERVVALTEPLIEKALELNPQLAKAHATQASVLLLVRDIEAAESGFRKALELNPNYSGAWSNLGWSLVLQSRLDEAAEAYNRSELLDPLNANVMYNVGALRMLTGHYEEGMGLFKKVIELAPERSGTEANIVHWSITYGRYEEAAQWITRLLEHRPDSARIATSLAHLYGNLGMWDEAWNSIVLANEKAPEGVSYLDRMGHYYYLTGDHAGFTAFVMREYDKIDQLAPSRRSPTNRARYLWHGIAALDEANYVQAIDDLTDAAGGQTGIDSATYDQITPLKYIAYALQNQGRYDEADVLLNKCLVLATKALDQGWATPVIYYRTAQVYALLGQHDDAIALLRQAVDKGWRASGRLERDALWSPMQDDVRFHAIIAGVNSEIRSQKERIKELLGDT